MADAGGRSTAISAAEVPPIRRRSALVRGGLPRNKFSPPSPRRIPRRKFLFRQKIFCFETCPSTRTTSLNSCNLHRNCLRKVRQYFTCCKTPICWTSQGFLTFTRYSLTSSVLHTKCHIVHSSSQPLKILIVLFLNLLTVRFELVNE